jgi:hypothetical protein
MSDDRYTTSYHKPVTTLEELDMLNSDETVEGHLSAQKGDPEPGANHSRAFYHGWRTRMMDLGEIEITPEHRELVRQWVARGRNRRSAENAH